MNRRWERGRWALVAALAVTIVAALPRPALAAVQFTLASQDPRGGGADRAVQGYPTLSPDGRYAAFYTDAHDLVPGDDAGKQDYDVYLRDLLTGTTVKVSVDRYGNDTTGDSSVSQGAVSEDGRYVAFTSNARDLVEDTHSRVHDSDVFVRDLVRGTTVRASSDWHGEDANGSSGRASITPDGRYVVFASTSTDLVAGDRNGTTDIFVRDLEAETTTRVSVDSVGGDSNGVSLCPSISHDGRYVAFESHASDLVPGDANGFTDIFLRDLVPGTTQRVSVDVDGGDADSYSTECPRVSGDGRSVAFSSLATDLVIGDGNGRADVFVRDIPSASTVRVSVDKDGLDANNFSFGQGISDDGRYVVFGTNATDIFEGDGDATWPEIGVRDLVVGVTIRITESFEGNDPGGWSYYPDISGDGHTVIFQSSATRLIPGLERVTKPQAFVAVWS